MEISQLKRWFLEHRRDLPWRENPTPYAVWISEVMLQQTQVAVVVPYFIRWMETFPSISVLASADLDQVIKLWEGLGYYSRARNLHYAAKYLVEKHGGELPKDEEELSKIKGLGPYTVGAIRSFAFHARCPAVDGNVIRVLTRFYGIKEDVTLGLTRKRIWEQAENLLPKEEPWMINEALIELGATVCKKKAECFHCPLKTHCCAYQQKLVDKLPYKSSRTNMTRLHRTVAVIHADDHFLLRRGLEGEVMQDLYEFPYIDQQNSKPNWISLQLGLDVAFSRELPMVKHTFTRFHVTLYPSYYECKTLKKMEDFCWHHKSDIPNLAFSSGHKRILIHNKNLFG